MRSVAPEALAAARFALVAAAVGVALLALGAVWMSTCTGGTSGDTVACGPVQITLLDLAAPMALVAAAAWAFWRGYARRGAAWHGAGVVLLFVTVATLIHG